MYILAGDWEMVLGRARTGLVYDLWWEKRSDAGDPAISSEHPFTATATQRQLVIPGRPGMRGTSKNQLRKCQG